MALAVQVFFLHMLLCQGAAAIVNYTDAVSGTGLSYAYHLERLPMDALKEWLGIWSPFHLTINCSSAAFSVLAAHSLEDLSTDAAVKVLWCGWHNILREPNVCQLSFSPLQDTFVAIKPLKTGLLPAVQSGLTCSVATSASYDSDISRGALATGVALILFYHADVLAKSQTFRLTSGGVLGITGFAVILLLMVMRNAPAKRAIGAGFAISASGMLGLVRWAYGTWMPGVQQLLFSRVGAWYLLITATAGVALTYWLDDPNNQKINTSIRVGLQGLALLVVYANIADERVGLGAVVLMMTSGWLWAICRHMYMASNLMYRSARTAYRFTSTTYQKLTGTEHLSSSWSEPLLQCSSDSADDDAASPTACYDDSDGVGLEDSEEEEEVTSEGSDEDREQGAWKLVVRKNAADASGYASGSWWSRRGRGTAAAAAPVEDRVPDSTTLHGSARVPSHRGQLHPSTSLQAQLSMQAGTQAGAQLQQPHHPPHQQQQHVGTAPAGVSQPASRASFRFTKANAVGNAGTGVKPGAGKWDPAPEAISHTQHTLQAQQQPQAEVQRSSPWSEKTVVDITQPASSPWSEKKVVDITKHKQQSPAAVAAANAQQRHSRTPVPKEHTVYNTQSQRRVHVGSKRYLELLSQGFTLDATGENLLPPPGYLSPQPSAAAAVSTRGAPSPASNLRSRRSTPAK